MKEMLEALREASRKAIDGAADMDALENLRIRYLGKKGELTALLKQMGKLSAEERPVIGQLANQIRSELGSGVFHADCRDYFRLHASASPESFAVRSASVSASIISSMSPSRNCSSL